MCSGKVRTWRYPIGMLTGRYLSFVLIRKFNDCFYRCVFEQMLVVCFFVVVSACADFILRVYVSPITGKTVTKKLGK